MIMSSKNKVDHYSIPVTRVVVQIKILLGAQDQPLQHHHPAVHGHHVPHLPQPQVGQIIVHHHHHHLPLLRLFLSVYEAVMINSILHCQSKRMVCLDPISYPHLITFLPGHYSYLVPLCHGLCSAAASHQHFLEFSYLLVCWKLQRNIHPSLQLQTVFLHGVPPLHRRGMGHSDELYVKEELHTLNKPWRQNRNWHFWKDIEDQQ